MNDTYIVQNEEEFPKKFCGYCQEASTYNEDLQCWCNKHNKEVLEHLGICNDYNEDQTKMKQYLPNRCDRCNKLLYYNYDEGIDKKNYIYHRGEYICIKCFYKRK